MTLEEQLRTLIESAPAHIQRHFACDCAERVLKWKGVEDKRSVREIAMWRRYADTKENAEDPDTLGDALRASKNAVEAAAWNASYEAHRFGRPFDVNQKAAAESERAWQIAHLQHAHNTARSSLLSVLQQRAESIQKALPRNKEALEETLFT